MFVCKTPGDMPNCTVSVCNQCIRKSETIIVKFGFPVDGIPYFCEIDSEGKILYIGVIT
ncbi:hypothetical protein SDC9_127059 [bioreactor metagenome]|uniref:Uncharacterized protein n=1 Tax=bioreactor metagenome TaxID=1076179 RepID=A0A645CSD3_9ZZZZ